MYCPFFFMHLLEYLFWLNNVSFKFLDFMSTTFSIICPKLTFHIFPYKLHVRHVRAASKARYSPGSMFFICNVFIHLFSFTFLIMLLSLYRSKYAISCALQWPIFFFYSVSLAQCFWMWNIPTGSCTWRLGSQVVVLLWRLRSLKKETYMVVLELWCPWSSCTPSFTSFLLPDSKLWRVGIPCFLHQGLRRSNLHTYPPCETEVCWIPSPNPSFKPLLSHIYHNY